MVASTHSIDKQIYELFTPKKDKEVSRGFEALYKNFLGKGAEEAKDYLLNLSQSQMQTIQKYHGLADAIDINSFDLEGAFNLLRKPYEKADINGDGLYNVGRAKTGTIIPPDAPQEFKQAFFEAVQEIKQNKGDKAAFSAMMSLSFEFNKHTINNHIEGANVAEFDFSYEGMQEYIQSKNNPQNGSYIAPELLENLNAFFESFSKHYNHQGGTGAQTVYSKESNDALKAMLEDLLEKGALKFLSDLNMEKIEKLIEQKQKELEAMYAKDDLKNPEVMAQIEDAIKAFRKELLEKLSKQSEGEGKTTVYSLKDLLHIKQPKEPQTQI